MDFACRFPHDPDLSVCLHGSYSKKIIDHRYGLLLHYQPLLAYTILFIERRCQEIWGI